jgi:hypothetical protein
VADEVAVIQLEVEAWAENVGAVDFVVQISGEGLAGIFQDGGDVLTMTTSTQDHHWTHS